MSKKPVVLMILDGYGLNKTHEGNAVYEAKKPVMDRLMKECPFVEGQASGLAVGLPDGQMGNSEVGHLNMGAGRLFIGTDKNHKVYPGRRFLQEQKSSLQLLRTARRITPRCTCSDSYPTAAYTAISHMFTDF